MSKLINRVEDLLLHGYKTASPQTLRDSDKALILAILDQDGLHLTDAQKRIYMASETFESITRARRALKAQYPASKRIDDIRYDKFKEYKYEVAYL